MLSESQKGGIRPKIYMAEFHCPYSRLKGHSCENCLSNCVLDLDLNMQTHFSSTLANVWEGEPIIAVATKMLAWRYAMNSYSQFEMGFKLKWNSKNSIPHFPSQHLFEANLFEWKSSGTETHPEHVQWKRCGKYTRVSYFSRVKEVMASWRYGVGVFVAGNSRFFNVLLQMAVARFFEISNPINTKKSNRWG